MHENGQRQKYSSNKHRGFRLMTDPKFNLRNEHMAGRPNEGRALVLCAFALFASVLSGGVVPFLTPGWYQPFQGLFVSITFAGVLVAVIISSLCLRSWRRVSILVVVVALLTMAIGGLVDDATREFP